MGTFKNIALFFVSVIFGYALLGPFAAAAANSPLNLFTIGGASNTEIVPLYPTWSLNIPLAPPSSIAAASSTGGSLTSTQTFYFKVAATNGTGTTTASSEIATTTSKGENVHISWTPVTGATNYFVYFSTTTPGAQNAYFVATTTDQYDFTSTTSPKFGTIPGFPSSFSFQAGNSTNFLVGLPPTFSTLSGGGTRCVQVSAAGLLSATVGGCGSGVGGGWLAIPGAIFNATTTDQILIDESSTSTNAKLEVNGLSAFLGGFLSNASSTFSATSTFNTAIKLGTAAARTNLLQIDCGKTFPASISVGGCVNITNTLNDNVGLALYTNHAGSATAPAFRIRVDNPLYDQEAATLQSVSDTKTTFSASGNASAQGVIKISHTGSGSDANASALSIDLVSSSTRSTAQGIFVTSSATGTTGKLIQVKNILTDGGSAINLFDLAYNGQTGIASSTPWALLSINPSGASGFPAGAPYFAIGSSTQTNFVINKTGVGIGTTSPAMALDVASGTIRAYSVSTSTCASANDGAVFYNATDKHLYVCISTVWQLIK